MKDIDDRVVLVDINCDMEDKRKIGRLKRFDIVGIRISNAVESNQMKRIRDSL